MGSASGSQPGGLAHAPTARRISSVPIGRPGVPVPGKLHASASVAMTIAPNPQHSANIRMDFSCTNTCGTEHTLREPRRLN